MIDEGLRETGIEHDDLPPAAKALEYIAQGMVGGAVRALAGEDKRLREAVIRTLQVAVDLDEDDQATVREWLAPNDH